jgi:hypothetical protein
MLAHLTGQPMRLRQINPELPARLERVIARSMAHRPDDRFASMQDFEEALDGAEGGT